MSDTKYIFVTGGVVSGLGKGISAASLGRLLKARGYKVTSQKLDPYINVDPGTMSPFQHGEVFVTDDGLEADLDLGHYERFIDENLHTYSNLTTGKVYWNVINKERDGKYLGETVQVIPHITDEIRSFIIQAGRHAQADVVITEIGGTTGDMESLPFLESIRQVPLIVGRNNCLFMHVTYIPYLSGSNEYKSKPTQHSVKELQSHGINPDMIVARCDEKIPNNVLDKISLFCNVEKDCVIENTTLESLYEVPLMFEEQNVADLVCRKLGLEERKPDLDEWRRMVDNIRTAKDHVRIALVGKYVQLHDAYLSVSEAVTHAGFENHAKVDIDWIDSETLDPSKLDELFRDVDGIIVPGGFGGRGIEGMIEVANYARTHRIPYLGICLGMQIAAIAFARGVLGYDDANSYEFDPNSQHTIIDFMEDQNDSIRKGGTMRLGAYPCAIRPNSLLNKYYKKDLIEERHRHRYEFNNFYRAEFEHNGMLITGTSPDKQLVEAIEFADHPYYVGVQYHPEFKSRPNRPHPLFLGLIESAIAYKKEKTEEA
ncbi:CTP synthase [uncultured Dubosiella sp.]|jgi:CTP synthase|uniref:CTP synthase n=2 Tax=uncultured Dubosiella sp. TaxID=1937011 RepID=UPI0025F7CF26|nr:CTP synthase [uncultured Dubosiella sp.]